MCLNKHLQPDMLNLVLNIASLTYDDLFFFKNKPRIDDVKGCDSRSTKRFSVTAQQPRGWRG